MRSVEALGFFFLVLFCLVCKCVTLTGAQVSVQGSCVSLWSFEAGPASEICSSWCSALVLCPWRVAEGCAASRSVPARTWLLCWKQVIPSCLVIQGMPESGQREQFKISSFNTFLPQNWVHTAWCHLSCGCGWEHLAIFAKSGLLGSNRGKELAQHAMLSLGTLHPPLFFSYLSY